MRRDAKARLRAERDAGEFAQADAAAERAEPRAGVMGRRLERKGGGGAVEGEGAALGDDGKPVRGAIFDVTGRFEFSIGGVRIR